jgi:acetone carboxylase gamma subunit
MKTVEEIIKAIDNELISSGKDYLSLSQANLLLVNQGFISIAEKSDKVIEKILEENKIPHAYQTENTPKQWRIPLSIKVGSRKLVIKPAKKVKRNNTLQPANYKSNHNTICPGCGLKLAIPVENENTKFLRCLTCGDNFSNPLKNSKRNNSIVKTDTSSKSKLRVYVIIFFAIIVSLVFFFNKKEKKDTHEHFDFKPQSRELIDQVHRKKISDYEDKGLIEGFSIEDISKYHFYFCIERWNAGGDIGHRRDTDYPKASGIFNLSASTLKQFDSYYNYEIMPQLSQVVRTIYINNRNLELNAYSPINQTAYCGIHTLMGWIKIYGSQSTNYESESEKIVFEIQSNLPEWITGFKFNHTVLIDTLLGTQEEVNLGFLWKKGENIIKMDAVIGTYPGSYSSACRIWPNDEWNSRKDVVHPKYSEPIY